MKRLYATGLALACVTMGSAALAQPAPARHFLEDAMKGDNSEIMLGQMAAERGASPGLRSFGQMLHDDHSKAREDAVRVASAMGVHETDAKMPEALAERRKLERLHGRAFDHEFARYMVGDHKKDIADFRKAARMDGPAGELARRTLPDLQKHLAMAQRLSRT